MKMSTTKHFSASRDIPSCRAIVTDASQLPFDYSTTPGGTIFSTTPGGTRIIYERGFLMQMRNSPVASTPPKNMPQIPGVTVGCPVIKSPSPMKTLTKPKSEQNNKSPAVNAKKSGEPGDEPQFEMDI